MEVDQQAADPTGHAQAGHRNSHLYRQGAAAAMFVTFQKTAVKATEFWKLVRDETGETPTLPDRKLTRYLLSLGLPGRAGALRGKVSTREVYVKCLHAWNAWRKGEATNLNYHADHPVPDVK